MKGNKKACRNCRALYSGLECPLCHSTQASETWKGKIIILSPEKSEIAKKSNLSKEGEYCVKLK